MSSDTLGAVTVRRDALTVETLKGAQAMQMIIDDDIGAAWDGLHSECEWGTVYQSRSFAKAWFRVYQASHEPIVLAAKISERTVGLLCLAREFASGVVGHVGTHHAEYHCWLTSKEHRNAAPLALLQAAKANLKSSVLRFLFVPGDVPLDWIADAERFGMRVVVRNHQRGIMSVGAGSDLEASLRKSGNKSRLSRLRRGGELAIERLHSRDELAKYIDEIAVQCDVRQGGVHGSFPFESDPLKREFYLALMDQPGLAHATIMRVNETVVASHLSVRDARMVPLGLITHAPHYGTHSPGKLMLLQLGRILGEEGYHAFDLTPGGDYKLRFASHFDESRVVDVHFSTVSYTGYVLRRGLARVAKLALHGSGAWSKTLRVVPRVARRAYRVNVYRAVAALVRQSVQWMRSEGEFRLYDWTSEPAWSVTEPRLRLNAIEDLLCYVPAGPSDADRVQFLAEALKRLESGGTLCSYVESGRLLHYSWITSKTHEAGSEYGHNIVFDLARMILWDDYTHPDARGRGLHAESLRVRVLYILAKHPDCVPTIGVRANNAPSRHNIEKVGFHYIGSASISTKFGRAARDVSVVGAKAKEERAGGSEQRAQAVEAEV